MAVGSYTPSMFVETPAPIPTIGTVTIADFPGQTLDQFELAKSIRGPVHVSRPEQDFTLPIAYETLFAALRERPDPTIYEFHPGADHGFSYMPGEVNVRAHRMAWGVSLSIFADAFAAAESMED
jgi:carboxymethylenebutenolidase